MLNDIIHNNIGWFHFITAVLAMLAGTIILFIIKKGRPLIKE